jgi:hypothetical protein
MHVGLILTFFERTLLQIAFSFLIEYFYKSACFANITSARSTRKILGTLLHVTTDLPTSIHTTTGTFADDTVILARYDDPVTASTNYRAI